MAEKKVKREIFVFWFKISGLKFQVFIALVIYGPTLVLLTIMFQHQKLQNLDRDSKEPMNFNVKVDDHNH